MIKILWIGLLFTLLCGAIPTGQAALPDKPRSPLAFTKQDVPGYQLRYSGAWRSEAGAPGFRQGFGREVAGNKGDGGYTIWVWVARCQTAAATVSTLKQFIERPVAVEWGSNLFTGHDPKVDQLLVNTSQMKNYGNYEVAGRIGRLAFHISLQSRGDLRPLPEEEAGKVDTMVRQLAARYSRMENGR